MEYTPIRSLGFLNVYMLGKYVRIVGYYSSKIRITSKYKHNYAHTLDVDANRANYGRQRTALENF
jgi:hypothetical protein